MNPVNREPVQVDETYRAANAQITTFSGNQWS
jgi:hypothetical protein